MSAPLIDAGRSVRRHRSTRVVMSRGRRPMELHWANAESSGRLRELAAANLPATALCGFTAVPPLRGTGESFPRHATVCLACSLIKFRGGAA